MKFHWKYHFKNTRHYFKFKVYTPSAAGITEVYFVLDNSGPSENHIFLTFFKKLWFKYCIQFQKIVLWRNI